MVSPVLLLPCLAMDMVMGHGLSDWFSIDTNEPDLSPTKDILLQRKGKFIKFDTKDNEMEIELGISIPFLKIPLLIEPKHGSGELGLYHDPYGPPSPPQSHNHKESAISINAPGLVVAGVLLLTSFLIVPFLFTKKTFGERFRSTFDTESPVWSTLKEASQVITNNQLESHSCMNKAVCWVAKSGSGGRMGQFIDDWLGTWWMQRLLGSAILDAVATGRSSELCEEKFQSCPFTQKHLKMAAAAFYQRR